ncbi:hypothetical protein ACF0H5_014021 [Mactra antiquata]
MGITWFELRLLKFDNPTGREADGDCCDFPCSDHCDPDITICFDNPDAGECKSEIRSTGHYHANVFNFGPRFENSAENPMSVRFKDAWPKTLSITVKVEDRDIVNAHDSMGKIKKLYTRVPAANKTVSLWNKVNFIFNYQVISAQARVYCDTNYYGEVCTIFCEPKDSDEEGHYTCAEDGSKVCNQYYHGPECKNYCVPADFETGHYYCDEIGQRICLEGWTGVNCTEDIDECFDETTNPCYPNGQCTNMNGTYECECTEGWIGKDCQEIKLYCVDASCSKFSTCNDTIGGFDCICEPGWTGTLCDILVTPCTSGPCKHSGICTLTPNGRNYLCNCVGPWQGRNCEEKMVLMLNDTKTIYLKGKLPENMWDNLTLGIQHLLKDSLKIADVAVDTTITYPNAKQTKVDIFVESQDTQVIHSLDKIMGLPEEKVKSSFILPLSIKQEPLMEPKLKPDPWVKKHWYVVLCVVLGVLIALAILVVVMYVNKTRRRAGMEKSTLHHNGRASSGRESLPDAAIGFDNSLYFESTSPEKVRGLPEIPKNVS